MRRIPDVVFNFSSAAEKKLFKLLGSVDLGSDWTAYHSLNLSEHEYKEWAEIDFLVVGPDCVLVLEAKGGRVSLEGGVWVFTDRYNREHRKAEGPFDQARSGMYSLQKRLRTIRELDFVADRRLTFGWGVLFPDIDWDVDTPEQPPEVVADRMDCLDPVRFARYLSRVSAYWREKNRRATSVDRAALTCLERTLRPTVDRYPPLTTRVGMVLDEMQELTDRQYDRLGIIEANDRVLVTGGAGTGKTFLALQAARRELAQGRTVLLVMSSPILRAWVRKLEPDRRLEVRTFAELARRRPDPLYDVLFVDEGQDLTNLEAIAVLSDQLEGGLDEGRWRWFMDDNRQAGLVGCFDPAVRDYLATGLGGAGAVKVPLSENVRNTQEVSAAVAAWTGADLGTARIGGHGREARILVADSTEGRTAKLGQLISKLLDEGAEPEEIGIVHSAGLDTASVWSGIDRNLRRRFLALDPTTAQAELRNRIVTGPPADFKGLERPIVVCIGFDSASDSDPEGAEFYVAVSRPNYGLYLITDAAFAERLTFGEHDQ